MVLAMISVGASAGWAANITYSVTADTSSIAGTVGYLDFQFNPGIGSPAGATALLESFGSDGILDLSPGVLLVVGDVRGDLPGTVTFHNTGAANEYSPGFTFGNTIQFLVNLSWTQPVPAPDAGSSFFFSMLDQSFQPLLTTNNLGTALELDINTDGTTTASSFSPQVAAGTVPEPGTWFVVAGLAVVALRARKKQ